MAKPTVETKDKNTMRRDRAISDSPYLSFELLLLSQFLADTKMVSSIYPTD